MMNDEYSNFQRIIGKLEGVGCCLPDSVQDYYLNVLEELDKAVERMRPEERP